MAIYDNQGSEQNKNIAELDSSIPYPNTGAYENILNVTEWSTSLSVNKTVTKNCILIGSIVIHKGNSYPTSGIIFKVNDVYMFNITNSSDGTGSSNSAVFLPLKKGDKLTISRADGSFRGILKLFDIA